MPNSQILRLAALELEGTESHQVVKIAGIIRRLRNYLKGLFDSKYKEEVDQLKGETERLQGLSKGLEKVISDLNSSIKEGDLVQYRRSLQEVKGILKEFVIEHRRMDSGSRKLYLELADDQDQYKKDFPKPFQSLDFNRKYDQPIADIKELQNLPFIDIRSIGPTSAYTNLRDKVSSALDVSGHAISKDEAKEAIDANKEDFLNNFRAGVKAGRLESIEPRGSEKKEEKGRIVLNITTEPFIIPVYNVPVIAKVKILDFRTTRVEKASLINTKEAWATYSAPRRAEPMPKAAHLKLAYSQEIPYNMTPLSQLALAQAMEKGYTKVFGKSPSLNALASGWAQAALESGQGQLIRVNNIGNIKASDDWVASGKAYATHDTKEKTKDGRDYTHKGAKWRAYKTPEEGAEGYWRFLKARFPDTINLMDQGQAHNAAVSLGEKGYYTANIQKYSGAVQSLYETFMKTLAPKFANLKSGASNAASNEAPVESTEQDSEINMIDSLIQKLFAKPEGPLEGFVKQNLIASILPTTSLLIMIRSENGTDCDRLEYARVASNILRRFVHADITIHKTSSDIEMQCSVLGSPLVAAGAVQAICDNISDAMLASTPNKVAIHAIPIPGFLSKYGEVDIHTLLKNHRIFNLKRLAYE